MAMISLFSNFEQTQKNLTRSDNANDIVRMFLRLKIRQKRKLACKNLDMIQRTECKRKKKKKKENGDYARFYAMQIYKRYACAQL